MPFLGAPLRVMSKLNVSGLIKITSLYNVLYTRATECEELKGRAVYEIWETS